MAGRLGFYRRTGNTDEQPLPVHEEENADIEMENFGEETTAEENFDQPEIPIKYVYRKRPQERCYCTWAITTTVLLLVFLIVAIKVHQSIRTVHWCCLDEYEAEKCLHMALQFQIKRFHPTFTCVNASSMRDCINKIDSDTADVVTISNSYLYRHKKNLKPIMVEDIKSDDSADEFGTFLVAIVKKQDKDTSLSRDGLRNRSAWLTEIELVSGYLYNTSVITDMTCNSPNALLNLFDSNLCFPTTSMIELCDVPGIKSVDERISSSLNNFLFKSSNKSVVFTDHITMLKHIPESRKNDFELLCPNARRASLDEYKTCHLLWQPSRALVVSGKIRSGSDIDIPADIVEVLHVAQLYFGSHSTNQFQMFQSNNNKTNLLFDDNTEKLVPLTINCTAENYLGSDYMRFRSSYDCETVQSNDETCFLPQYHP